MAGDDVDPFLPKSHLRKCERPHEKGHHELAGHDDGSWKAV
jgi:hypothetical protein